MQQLGDIPEAHPIAAFIGATTALPPDADSTALAADDLVTAFAASDVVNAGLKEAGWRIKGVLDAHYASAFEGKLTPSELRLFEELRNALLPRPSVPAEACTDAPSGLCEIPLAAPRGLLSHGSPPPYYSYLSARMPANSEYDVRIRFPGRDFSAELKWWDGSGKSIGWKRTERTVIGNDRFRLKNSDDKVRYLGVFITRRTGGVNSTFERGFPFRIRVETAGHHETANYDTDKKDNDFNEMWVSFRKIR